MEAIALTFFILTLLGYLVSDDYVGHLWGVSFFNTFILFLLLALVEKSNTELTINEIGFLYISLNILLFSGIFVLRSKPKTDKLDEIDR